VWWQTCQLCVMYVCEPKENVSSTCFAFGELKPNINWNKLNCTCWLQHTENWNLARMQNSVSFPEVEDAERNISERIWTFLPVTHKVSQVTQLWNLICRQQFYFFFFNLIWRPYPERSLSFCIYLFYKILLLYFPSSAFLTIMCSVNTCLGMSSVKVTQFWTAHFSLRELPKNVDFTVLSSYAKDTDWKTFEPKRKSNKRMENIT
jgi:hypothetical protein